MLIPDLHDLDFFLSVYVYVCVFVNVYVNDEGKPGNLSNEDPVLYTTLNIRGVDIYVREMQFIQQLFTMCVFHRRMLTPSCKATSSSMMMVMMMMMMMII